MLKLIIKCFEIKVLFVLLIILLSATSGYSQVYQWSVELEGAKSNDKNSSSRAFLWIPENCQQVRAVVFGQQNMCEEAIFNRAEFRKTMKELGFAIVWVNPGFEQQWKVENGCQKIFETMMNDFAEVSGYSELKYAPIVPLGHSAMATFPWNFAAWNPECTLAVISFHGDAPRTNLTGYGRENLEWGRTRNIDGIPGLMIEGEYEWWEARVNPALAFRMMYPESCISFLCDAGRGHFDVSEEVVQYMCKFLTKASDYRLPKDMPLDKPAVLNKIDVNQGYLAERWHPNQINRTPTAPYLEYKGDSHDAFWYFDKDIAEYTEAYYASEQNKRNQYIGIQRNGKFEKFNPKGHAKYQVWLSELDADLKFTVTGVYTDSLRENSVLGHSTNKINIYPLSESAVKLNDSTFALRFTHLGKVNNRRASTVSLIAQGDGDAVYKTSVQEMTFNFNYPQTEGAVQQIRFDSITNLKTTAKPIVLKAKSDKGLPVYFFVKEGPALIQNGKVVFTEIPPRAKYPIKVSVVAWQYGKTKGEKIQSAEPIERIFYINN